MKNNWFNRTFRRYALNSYLNNEILKDIQRKEGVLKSNKVVPEKPKYTTRFIGKFISRRYN